MKTLHAHPTRPVDIALSTDSFRQSQRVTQVISLPEKNFKKILKLLQVAYLPTKNN
jgi:hypothetical protein